MLKVGSTAASGGGKDTQAEALELYVEEAKMDTKNTTLRSGDIAVVSCRSRQVEVQNIEEQGG